MNGLQTELDIIESRALSGDIDAQYYLSLLYEGIRNCPKNLEKSAQWCTRAAKNGDKQAQYRLAKMHETGRGFDKARERAAWYWLRESALKGHVQAQFELGVRHLFGCSGVRKSLNHARRLLLEAANKEHPEAMYYLGFMHMHALGYSHDCGSAYIWFCRAAELNCQKSQCSLGFFYAHGICCELDMERARYWYERAAMQGHLGAQFALACLYISLGQFKNAVVWMSISANQGLAPAQALLAKMYRDSTGVECDLIQSLMWCLIAKAQPQIDIDSLETVLKCQSSIVNSSDSEIVSKAKKLAKDWFKVRNQNELAERI